ncbi:MAG: Trm112 family protein [Methylobacteriaceae bacterium]|nr:Trm112 family protein [Methylobacteriaceae bacterium]MBV9221277.1 Trm112 family protein [Methylobacteriaceae bacterium]MBV9245579.1 Trm112 family protein [Methylobacteriaceae bacterium]MBV9635370.1 Trm112 family protein [Methylobacteriaceae bacterium]MBV9703505.1 Trm112 family protein [Methylobacteriaceae bacterium]
MSKQDDTAGPVAAPVTEARGTRIDPRLLEILVCPLTKSTLEYDSAKQELISRAAKLAYPIRDGIPIMLPEEARSLEE